jgi:hypothetical protein
MSAVVTDALVMMIYPTNDDVEFEAVEIAALVRNVVAFMLATKKPAASSSRIADSMRGSISLMQSEGPATPEDAAGKSREETPREGRRVATSFATTELEAWPDTPAADREKKLNSPKASI